MRRISLFVTMFWAACVATALCAESTFAQEATVGDVVLEALPDDVLATMEARDKWIASLPPSDVGLQFFVEDAQRWTPGSTVRVAFLGGTTALHKQIADATNSITDHANLKLDFGLSPTTGGYRTWSTGDTSFSAEIRVSFDQGGNFSLVGRDSINQSIGSPLGTVGGRPHQRSLNLGGYDVNLPASWMRTVRHEFLHAIAFHHEHQNLAGGCDSQFRWEDDPGYIIKQDAGGRFIENPTGRFPGIYTFMSGAPNFWSRAKVDHNMRQVQPTSGMTIGSFDRASIMLYRFPPTFYVTNPSPCAPSGGTEDLSAGDIAGLKHLYPSDTAAVAEVQELSAGIIKSVQEFSRNQGFSEATVHALEGIE